MVKSLGLLQLYSQSAMLDPPNGKVSYFNRLTA